MKLKNWPETKQAFVNGEMRICGSELRICGELTATIVEGVTVLILTPSTDELKKAVEALGIQWAPFGHKPATVVIAKE